MSRLKPFQPRLRRVIVASSIALCLTQAVLSAPAGASPAPVAGPGGSAAQPSAAQDTAAQASASAAADQSGHPVEVAALTTETSQVLANPGGTFSLTTNREPVRVRKNGSWTPIDTSLRANADGSLSPAATAQQLRLSGGGTGPLITVARDGNEVDFWWPAALPRPVVARDTATFSEVLPGVDLQVSASAEQFSEVLVIKNAAAAANPALAAVRLRVSSPTLSISSAANGGLRATDSTGKQIFAGSQPTMWDSNYNPHLGGRPTAKSAGGARPKAVAMSVTARRASTAGSGQATGGSSADIVLAPSASALTGKAIRYPVYLDPQLGALKLHYAWVSDDGQRYVDSGTELKVGYCGWDTPVGDSCGTPYWTARSYFSLNTQSLTGQATTAHIFSASLHASQIHNAVCDSTAVWLLASGAITSTMTWPGPSGSLIESESSAAGSSCTPSASDVIFNSTNLVSSVQTAANSDVTVMTFALSNPYDTTRPARDFWKKFGTNPSMTVVYNFPPSVPTGLTMPGAVSCNGNNYTSTTGNQTFTASAQDNNPKQDGTPGALQPGLWFEVHPWLDSTTILASNSSAIRIASGATGSYTTQRSGGFPIGLYQAWVKADNQPGSSQDLWSGYTAWYFFNTRSPITQTPTIRSLDYPSGNWGAPHNKPGTFTLDVNGATTAAGFSFAWDSANTPVVTGCDYNRPSVGIVGTTNTISITPPTTVKAGRHTLYVRTFDDAHNLSTTTASYTFYISPDLGSTTTPTHLEAENLSVSQPTGQAVDTPTVVDVVRNTNGTDRVTLGLQANPTGYHSDGEFGGAYVQLGGAYTQQVAGTHPLYDCLTGTDHFTSTSIGCENRTMVALIGYVYDTAQSDPPTSPIYRCRTSTDHYDSYWSNCGGATVESVQGYFLNTSGRAFSGKRAVTVAATAVDQKVSLNFTASVTAYYALGIQLQTGNEGGQFAFTLDDDAAHPLANTDPGQHIGISTDSVFGEKYVPLGGQHFDAGSTHTIDLIVTSAGGSTGGYRATVDFLSLIPLNNVSYPGLAEAMNNHGISADGTTANFDLNGGDALSLQALTAAGYGPGATVTAGSGADAATFTMPKPHLDAQGSTVDNVIATGQTIPLPHVKTSSVRMLVTSTCGSSAQADSVASSFHFKEVDDDPFSGSGAPRYQDITMPTIPDWTSLDGVSSIPGGAQISLAVQLPYRNQFDGTKAWWSNVYLVSLPVDPTYTLDSVTLPDLGSDLLTCVGPTLHVLAMSVAAPADTVGIYRPSQTAFFLRQSDGSSAFLPFGVAGDKPVSGDWDGDGSKTIGTYRPSNKTFYLSNSNSTEDQLVTVASAAAGDIPVTGDWDGDGKTTVGLYRPSTSVFYLINDLANPGTQITLGYGTAGDLPVVGDWDGNGTTTVGIWRASNLTFYIDNSNTSSATYTTIAMGVAGDLPVAGDWDGNGSSTVGVWRPSNTTFYLNNNQLASSTVTTINYGLSGDAVTVVNKQG